MAKTVIDMRSDTVTIPTPAMVAAMASAEVGDDVYGEDPTVLALEQETAALLGKDAALYVPSGTMANQLAIALHTRPGDSVIAEVDAHCYLYEAGAAAALSGVQFDLLPLDERMTDQAIEAAYKGQSIHTATTSLLVVENTHNRGAGRVLDLDELGRITSKGKSLGLATHCDGARLWNAAVALKAREHELVAGFDTVAVCFSKGLGAPIGSALAGSSSHIERARKLRKRWGGGMRQAGYIAAGALYALRHHRARLSDDHAHAAMLAEALETAAKAGAAVEWRYPNPGTNIVYFRLGLVGTDNGDASLHCRRLSEEFAVLLNSLGGGWLRAVTHLGIGHSESLRAAEALYTYARRL